MELRDQPYKENMRHEEQLIYIDPDEEITAIIDRLRQTDASMIRLVVPKGALILQSLVSLKLLKREADQLKKRIALVTQDPIGERLAPQAELAVFRKPKDSQPVVAAPYETSFEEETELAPEVEPEEVPEGLSVHHYEPLVPASDSEASEEASQADDADEPQGISNDDQVDASQRLPNAAAKALGRRQPSGRGKKFFMFLVILGGVGLLAWLVFMEFAPRAVIAMTLSTEPLEQAVVVKADLSMTDIDLSNAKIPAERQETQLEVAREAPATGKKQIGEKATVSLSLYNYWDSNPQSIVAGTQLIASDGTPFQTLESVTIPGASTTLSQGKIVTTPGKVNVVARAEQAGTAANGKSGTFTIPSLPTVRQDKIYGESVNPSAGGTSREVTIVTSNDINSLKNAAQAAFRDEGKAKLVEASDRHLLDGAIEYTITQESASAAVDAEAETIRYTVTGTLRALLFDDSQLKDAALAILTRTVPSGRTVILRDSDTLSAAAENIVQDPGTMDLKVTIATHTALALELEDVAGSVTGLGFAEAESRLRETAGITDVTITSRPRWLKSLPKRPGQIEIVINYAVE